MVAPGSQLFTYFQTGKESAAGTAVACTRMWYPDGTGMFDIDPMFSEYRGNRGTRTQLAGAISKGMAVSIPYRSNPDIGVGYDELTTVLSQVVGGGTGAGAQADKTWTFLPSQTASNTPESFTIRAGDDTQGYRFEYSQLADFTISASKDSMTTLEANWFARQPTKEVKTAVAANTAVRIPGYLWKPRWATAQSGLAGASDTLNFMVDWSLHVETGLVPRFYQDGLTYFGQSVEAAPLRATLTLHVESLALAVSEFYDKWLAATVDFMQLKAIGPVLGGTFYSAQIQLALLYQKVQPISAEDGGVNIYEITAETAIDPTWAQSMGFVVVNTLATST